MARGQRGKHIDAVAAYHLGLRQAQHTEIVACNGTEMVVVRPPKGMIGADYRRRREYSLREWIKYQKYLDTKGKWRG